MVDEPEAKRCPFCGKPFDPMESEAYAYCSMKCKDQHTQEQITKRKAKSEADRLLEQYQRGGWKP